MHRSKSTCMLDAGVSMEACVEDSQPSMATSRQQSSLAEDRPVADKRQLIVDQLENLNTTQLRFVSKLHLYHEEAKLKAKLECAYVSTCALVRRHCLLSCLRIHDLCKATCFKLCKVSVPCRLVPILIGCEYRSKYKHRSADDLIGRLYDGWQLTVSYMYDATEDEKVSFSCKNAASCPNHLQYTLFPGQW